MFPIFAVTKSKQLKDMKKIVLFIVVVLSAMLAQAKDHTVVVKGGTTHTPVKTEVKIEQGNESDTIVIVPGVNATDFEVTISDTSGNVVAQYYLSADTSTPVDVNTPDLPDTYVVEVRDNRGIVFSGYELQ